MDEAWEASPVSQDTQWAQVNSAPVSPSNSGANGSVAFYETTIVTRVDEIASVYAACPAGKNVISGGGSTSSNRVNQAFIFANRPQGNGWLYTVSYGYRESFTVATTAWVGCQ